MQLPHYDHYDHYHYHYYKMETIFMNTKNSGTNKPQDLD